MIPPKTLPRPAKAPPSHVQHRGGPEETAPTPAQLPQPATATPPTGRPEPISVRNSTDLGGRDVRRPRCIRELRAMSR